MTEQEKKDLAELFMKLHLLGWALDPKYTVYPHCVFDAPDSHNGDFRWISANTKENGSGTAGGKMIFDTFLLSYKDLIEIIEQKDN